MLTVMGSAGAPSIPGLSADGLIPPGIIVAGALSAGDQTAPTAPSYNNFYGAAFFLDTPGNQPDADNVVYVEQREGLIADCALAAHSINRDGALNGHAYTAPTAEVVDTTGSAADLQQWKNGGGVAARVGQAGGLGLFGVVAPAVPRTLAQATITAITDANAKTAVQAVANALSDMGALTLT